MFILACRADAAWAASGDTAGACLPWAGWLASGLLFVLYVCCRRRAGREEERRKQAENMLTYAVDTVPDPLFVKDEQGRFLLINKAYAEAYGMDGAVCVGKTLPEIANFMTPEKRLALHEHDLEFIRAGGSRNVDCEAAYASGDVRQGQCRVSTFPLSEAGPAEAARGLVGLFSDRTESRRLIRELHRVNGLSSVALELAQAGDWRLAPETNGDFIVSEHGRAILGDSPTPGDPWYWRLRDWEEAMSAADPEQARASAQRYAQAVAGSGQSYDETYPFRRPGDDRQIWVHDRGLFERDADGTLRAMRGVIQDITIFKQAEDAAREAKLALEREARNRSEFLVNMSHELRTPMTGILGMSHLAMQSGLSPVQQGYVRAIEVSGQILMSIFNDILEYAKLDSGTLSFERIDFPLRDMLDHALAHAAAQAREKGGGLLVRVDDAVPDMLKGDPDRLGQILRNLADSALKRAERSEVAVRVELAELDETGGRTKLRFRVQDSGPCLAEHELSQLFTPFALGDDAGSRYGGTGLGLAISKRLVEMQDGALEIVSQPEAGTTFSFTLSFGLPVPDEQAERPECTREDMLRVLKGAKVLLAEDNEINQIVVNDILTRLGVRVRIAEDGLRAVDMIREGDYDAVLMDIQMPIMDGYEATRLLRAESRFACLPIIALTAHAMPEDRHKSLESGMNDHLPKPIDPDKLFMTLAHWLAKK